jgi:fructose-1-phosphate kinase PfkB-like protein
VEHLLEIGAKYNIPVALVSASLLKLYNIPENLKGLKLLITKHDETEKHFGIEIKDDASLREALQLWMDQGVQHVIITRNSQSVGYASEKYGMHVYDLKNSDKDSDTYIWGTNEALCAGIVYSYLRTDDITEMIQTGLANAVMSSKSAYKVRPNLSQSVLRKDVKEIGKLESREI